MPVPHMHGWPTQTRICNLTGWLCCCCVPGLCLQAAAPAVDTSNVEKLFQKYRGAA